MSFSKKYKFSDWPNPDIPLVSAGVYVIWNKKTLMYCGMSGRGIEHNRHKKKYGLITRLNRHASGRQSGDQFCVYVGNRLVIPALKPEDLPKFARGDMNLDMLVKTYIHTHLEYQYALVETSEKAYACERKARTGETFGQKPFLNPLTI